MKVAASPRSMAQVAAVLAFVISHTMFRAAQDDETGRCPKVCDGRFPRIASLPHAGNAIKLSGRTFLAPHRGSSPKGRGGYVAVLHESVEISIASDYST